MKTAHSKTEKTFLSFWDAFYTFSNFKPRKVNIDIYPSKEILKKYHNSINLVFNYTSSALGKVFLKDSTSSKVKAFTHTNPDIALEQAT